MQKEEIIESLKAQGCRITKQRLTLLDVILEEDCTCCKEIYYKASLKDSGIGMATVYRMVNMLEQIGAIGRRRIHPLCSDGKETQKEQKTGPDQGCSIELSDHTVCSLSSERLRDVMQAGLRACGYIGDQKIESILLRQSDGISGL